MGWRQTQNNGEMPRYLLQMVTELQDPIAKLYGILANGGSRDGIHVLTPETIEMSRLPQSEGKDLVLGGMNTKFGLGFMLGNENISMGPNNKSFGHGGAGGSLGFCDPDNHVSLGFVMNQMHPGITA